MYVVVIGMGQVGRHILQTLELEGHDIVAIDQDPQVIADIEEHHDVGTLLGYGATASLLEQAGVKQADLVAAVTDHCEVNLIAALAAKQAGAKTVVARVSSAQWATEMAGVAYGLLGVDVVINPQVLVAQEIAKIARSHGALEVVDLANDRIELVQIELGDSGRMLHKPLAKLEMPPETLVAAIVRDGELSVPGGADVLLPGDRIYLLGRPETIEAAEDKFTTRREARSVVIVGGGVIGTALARHLSREGAEVLLIERDAEVARQVGAELDRVTVVHGDGTDLSLLLEENVGDFDLFVSAAHDDEVNLMSGLLAKRAGADRTLSVVHRPDYMAIYRQLGIDIVISPRLVASEHVLRYTRSTAIRSLIGLEGGQAEVLEIEAVQGSRAVDVPLRRLNIPRGTLLAAIVRDAGVTIPRGDDVIRPGDTVIVLATEGARTSVARLFQQRAL